MVGASAGAAVVCVFDDDATARVEALWRLLADAGLSSSQERLGYRPHLTLALARDASARAVGDAVAGPVAAWSRFPVWLNGLATFAGGPGILYLSTTVSTSLAGLQELVSERVAGLAALHEHSRFWTPHVTLASDLQPEAVWPAMRLVSSHLMPFRAQVVAVEVVRPSPVEVVRRISLRPEAEP
jgi:2'-5' RNA ligase